MADLITEVAKRHGVTVSEIKGKGRMSNLVIPRDEFVYECRLAGKSFPMIGKFLNRHHTTIIASERRYLKRLEKQ
jgi:chromosomal replication initiation ATPase DnaA